jgi:hypothetical protein
MIFVTAVCSWLSLVSVTTASAQQAAPADKLWTLVPAQTIAAQFIQSFKDYPPSQRSGSMNLDQVMEALSLGASGAGK